MGFYILKNNIQAAFLEKENLRLKYNWKDYSVSVNEINSINSALDRGITIKGKFSTIYTIELKRKYKFGKKLYLRYSHSELPISEPKEISILKAFIEFEINNKKETPVGNKV